MLFNARSWDGFKKQEEKFMEGRTIKIKLLAQEAAELQIAGSREDTQAPLSFPQHLLLGTAGAGHCLGLTPALTPSALPYITFWPNGTSSGGLLLP